MRKKKTITFSKALKKAKKSLKGKGLTIYDVITIETNWSKQHNPKSWTDDDVYIIRFPFNIEKFCRWVRDQCRKILK